jgi:opacity protein-like surface antigen
MRKIFTIGLLSAISCSSMAAVSVDGLYLKGFGGVAMGSTSGLNSVEPLPSITSGIKTTDTSGLFGIAIGYTLPDSPLSLELQAIRLNSQSFTMDNFYHGGKQEVDKLNVRSNVYLLNALYALPSSHNFTPFIGAGIGMAQNKVSGNYYNGYNDSANQYGYWTDKSNNNFAYDLTVGVSYQFTEHFSTSLAYQYLSLGKLATHDTAISGQSGLQTLSADRFASNNVILGITYKF